MTHLTHSQRQIITRTRLMLRKRITPCGKSKVWSKCFTEIDGKTIFWFNTPDDSTHTIRIKP